MDSERQDGKDRQPVWQRSDQDRQIDADAYHIWTPRPLIRSVYWRPETEPPRDAVAGSYEVFIDQRAYGAMHAHVWGAGPDESPFGYLVGDLCEDPSASRRFIIVTQVIPSRFPFRENDPEQIGGEASVALQLEVERKRGVLVGWYHQHDSGEARLSQGDVATHEGLFPEPWQIAVLFITDARSPAGATFRRTPEGFDGNLHLPFYEMVTNESLLAKGVRRSRVDWENVSTLDQIRAEPPPRPEPPSRPESAPEQEATAEPVPEPVSEQTAEPESKPAEPPAVESVGPMDLEPESDAPEAERDEEAALDSVDEGGQGSEPEFESDSGGARSAESTATEIEPTDEASDDLDLDALIAEVESAGLEDELEVEVVETPESVEGAREPDMQFEDVFDALAEVEEDLTSGGEPGLAADMEGLIETESEATPVADPETATVVDHGVLEEKEPDIAGHERIPDAATPPIEESPSAPPATDEPRDAFRRWALPAIGIVITLGVVAVLFQVMGGRPEEMTTVEPVPAETTPDVETPLQAPDQSPGDNAEGEPGGIEGETSGAAVTGQAGGAEPVIEGTDPAATDAVATDAGAGPPPGPAADPVTIEALRGMSDQVVETISSFYGRTGAFDSGEIGCAELQASFVEVMDSWIEYSTRGKADWQGRLPPDVEERDERLYRGVQDVERLFESSSCPRP